jgi:hypothetical protein
MARGLYVYWDDTKVVNFLAAWIPFVLSILIAFVPEHEMSTIKKILWRSSVIVVGFAWSVVLWHQQVVADNAAKDDQRSIVREAVNQSNQHSDKKIESVQTEVKGVKTDIGGVKENLKDTKDTLSKMVTKSESDITSSLSKVGKPEPQKPSVIVFSLWSDDESTYPLLKESLAPDRDGIFTVDVTFKNTSETPANTLDIWVSLCAACEWAEEIPGFARLKGMPVQSRHRMVNFLNPGVSFEKTTIKLRLLQPIYSGFTIDFRYSCTTCGKITDQQRLVIAKVPISLGEN